MSAQNIPLSHDYTNTPPASVTINAADAPLLSTLKRRRRLRIQNQSNTLDLWINIWGGAAVADGTCFKLSPNQVYDPSGWIPSGTPIRAIASGAGCIVSVLQLGDNTAA